MGMRGDKGRRGNEGERREGRGRDGENERK